MYVERDGQKYIFEIFLNSYPPSSGKDMEIIKINKKFAYLYRRFSNSFLLCHYISTELNEVNIDYMDVLDYIKLKYDSKPPFITGEFDDIS